MSPLRQRFQSAVAQARASLRSCAPTAGEQHEPGTTGEAEEKGRRDVRCGGDGTFARREGQGRFFNIVQDLDAVLSGAHFFHVDLHRLGIEFMVLHGGPDTRFVVGIFHVELRGGFQVVGLVFLERLRAQVFGGDDEFEPREGREIAHDQLAWPKWGNIGKSACGDGAE